MTTAHPTSAATDPLGSLDLGNVHFIGMGGAGMSAIARIMLAEAVPVSGSDAAASAGLSALESLGATVFVGQRAENIAGATTVVVSSAIRETNPELAAARAAGLRILHRSEALAATMAGRRVVAVAGTHGKTTTTAMIAVLLRGAGESPSFAIGGTVPALGVNAALGTGELFVAEADESDGSFLNYRPQIAVITNVEPDHLDHYGTAEAVYAAFDDFAALLPVDGLLVACADDDGARALASRAKAAGKRVCLYGTASDADVLLMAARNHEGLGTSGTISWNSGAERVERDFPLAVPGMHNATNAAAALAVALELGIDPEQAIAALATFSGAARRFEAKGQVGGIWVFDDYAHHPTEVTAALKAAREVAGEHQVHVLFQPHLFSRTREFAAEFATALQLADAVAVLDIYPAREDPIPGVTSELITRGLDRSPGYATTPEQAVDSLVAQAVSGDVILTVGAGSVTELGAKLLAALAAREGGADGLG